MARVDRQLPQDERWPAVNLRDTLEHLLSGKSLGEDERGECCAP
jgi:hypothetical protein